MEELVTLCNGLQKENCLMKQSMQRHEHVATKLAEAAKATAEVDARVQVLGCFPVMSSFLTRRSPFILEPNNLQQK